MFWKKIYAATGGNGTTPMALKPSESAEVNGGGKSCLPYADCTNLIRPNEHKLVKEEKLRTLKNVEAKLDAVSFILEDCRQALTELKK